LHFGSTEKAATASPTFLPLDVTKTWLSKSIRSGGA